MRLGILLILAITAATPAAAEGDRLQGPATVISGDTLVVQGQRMHLFGIDAPDKGQPCQWPNKVIDCGNISRTALLDLIAPVEIACRRRNTNADGTWIATCKAEGFDVGSNMIYTGWAMTPPGDPAKYGKVQENAKTRKRGMWKGTFEMPWIWRKAQ